MSDSSPPCPHGLRPGTTVCLHCRHDARVAARRRRFRLAARVGLISTGGAAVAALVIGGLSAIVPDGGSFRGTVRESLAEPAGRPLTETKAPPTPPSRQPRPSTMQPVVAPGRSELGDSIFAEHANGEVTVHFDTDTLRTRYDWKFERIVRATLPVVFGSTVRPALEAIPEGTLVRGGDLLLELPERGIPIAIPDRGHTLTVWPITRPGRDGLIVVAYRATVAR